MWLWFLFLGLAVVNKRSSKLLDTSLAVVDFDLVVMAIFVVADHIIFTSGQKILIFTWSSWMLQLSFCGVGWIGWGIIKSHFYVKHNFSWGGGLSVLKINWGFDNFHAHFLLKLWFSIYFLWNFGIWFINQRFPATRTYFAPKCCILEVIFVKEKRNIAF